jgi:hypothetical protein
MERDLIKMRAVRIMRINEINIKEEMKYNA